MVTDYVQKAGDWVAETLANCLVIINWFTGHKRALSMLLEKQRSANAPRLRSFIRAATTRWTTHYLSTRRMLDLKRMLRSLCEEHYDTLRLAGGEKEEQVEAAEKVLSIITEDRNFWSNLRVYVLYCHSRRLLMSSTVSRRIWNHLRLLPTSPKAPQHAWITCC